MTEETLSDKIEGNMFRYIDVKNFIKKLKEFVNECFSCSNKCSGCLYDILNEIDKLAGKELSK